MSISSPRLLVAVLTATFAICNISHVIGQNGGEKVPVEAWGAEQNGFQLSLRLEKGEYTVGEPVPLKLILKNVSEKQASVPAWQPLGPYKITIVRGGDIDVPLTAYGKQQIELAQNSGRRKLRLEPDETAVSPLADLSRNYDMSLPGEYTIVVERSVPARDEQKTSAKLVSNSVVVKVVSP